MELKKLLQAKRTVTVEYFGDSVEVTYRLGAINTEFTDWAAKHERDPATVRDGIERLVESWDVLDDNGERILPMREQIERHEIPVPFLNAVVETVMRDANSARAKTTDARTS